MLLLFPHSLDTDSTIGGVSRQPAVASLSLLHTCLDSGVDSSQHCNMYEYIVKAVTCARLVRGQSDSAYFILHVCYRSRLSSNTYIELRETDMLVTIGDVTGKLLDVFK